MIFAIAKPIEGTTKGLVTNCFGIQDCGSEASEQSRALESHYMETYKVKLCWWAEYKGTLCAGHQARTVSDWKANLWTDAYIWSSYHLPQTGPPGL